MKRRLLILLVGSLLTGCRHGPLDDLNPTTINYLNLPFATMTLVKGGSFQMGNIFNDAEEVSSEEKPVHQVTLTNFYMGQYEVTQRQWQTVMGNNPSTSSYIGCDDCPVENVSWNDIQAFIKKLNDQRPTSATMTYRLPTEAEWEYAAGGGATNRTRFGNGKDIANPAEINYYGLETSSRPSYSVVGEYRQRPVKVGSFPPNALNLYDMSGNVAEWCNDWYDSYGSGTVTNPSGPVAGLTRVERGGSWDSYSQYCRVAYRGHAEPTFRFFKIGFRLVAQ